MAAARLLAGLAGGRLCTAAAAIGPRLAPLALHAGRRCPLAPALLGASAPGLLAPRAPGLLRRAAMPVKLHPFGTKEAGADADKTQEAGADITGETVKATYNASGRAKDCDQVDDAVGRTKDDDCAAASDGHITKGGGGGGGDSKPDGSATATGEPNHKSDSNDGEEDAKLASRMLLLEFAKVVKTVLTKLLKAERKRADEHLQDHLRRIVYLILSGVLLELIVVVAAAMVIGTWIGILKMKEILNYLTILTTSPESMETYLKFAEIALSLLYDAFVGKVRNMIASVLSPRQEEEAIAGEETKTGEEARLGEVENGQPAGEDGASDRAGEEGAGTGEEVVLMLRIFAIFVF